MVFSNYIKTHNYVVPQCRHTFHLQGSEKPIKKNNLKCTIYIYIAALCTWLWINCALQSIQFHSDNVLKYTNIQTKEPFCKKKKNGKEGKKRGFKSRFQTWFFPNQKKKKHPHTVKGNKKELWICFSKPLSSVSVHLLYIVLDSTLPLLHSLSLPGSVNSTSWVFLLLQTLCLGQALTRIWRPGAAWQSGLGKMSVEQSNSGWTCHSSGNWSPIKAEIHM